MQRKKFDCGMQPRFHLAVSVGTHPGGNMNSIVYLVGLVVIVIAILSFIGLR